MKVIWSAQAKKTCFSVLEYLQDNWTKKEIIQFNNKTEAILRAISKHPKMFPQSKQNESIRKAVIDKNNSLFYTEDVQNQTIFILTFFDNSQDPGKLNLR